MEDLDKQQRFLREIEQAIRLSNQEVIHQNINPISRDRVVAFSVAVAKLRMRYLEEAFRFASADHGDGAEKTEVAALQERRLAYDEGLHAFEALHRAIERGYIKVADA